MTPEQRKARAQRFSLWWEQDGMKDAVQGIADTYIARIAKLDPTDREFGDKAKILSIAAKVVEQVEATIMASIAEGSVAQAEIERTERLSGLSKERRRFF